MDYLQCIQNPKALEKHRYKENVVLMLNTAWGSYSMEQYYGSRVKIQPSLHLYALVKLQMMLIKYVMTQIHPSHSL